MPASTTAPPAICSGDERLGEQDPGEHAAITGCSSRPTEENVAGRCASA